jgi:hypothetical protein
MTARKILNTYKLIFSLSLVIFISSVGVKFYFCNSVTVKNSEFEQASTKRAELESEIKALKVRESGLSSIENLEKRSKEMGFIEMEDRLVSIDLDAPVQVAVIN